jgi:serine/threonine protein kinase
MYNDWYQGDNVFSDAYELQTDLGKGAQGKVCKVFHKRDKMHFSMKKVDINFNSPINCLNVLREIKILKNITHRHIIGLKEVLAKETMATYDHIYLITDLMDIDLKNVIYSEQDLTIEHVKKIAFQIITGIEYIHRKGIMHRDIKPANILVNKDCNVKLCDFGMAKANLQNATFEGRQFPMNSCNVTTRWYRAPEVLFEFDDYTESMDVWSFGCVLAEMLTRQPFMRGKTDLEQVGLVADLIGHPPREIFSRLNQGLQDFFEDQINMPKNFKKMFLMLDKDGIDLLQRIFTYDYKRRISAKAILEHPFFSEESDESRNELQEVLDSVNDEDLDIRLFSFETKELSSHDFRRLIFVEQGEYM